MGKFQSSSSASTSNVIDQFVKQHQSSPFNQIPEEVLNTLETLGDEKAAALIMGLIEETEQLEQECPRLIANEQKAKLDEQIGAIRKRMDDSHQRYLNLLKTLENLPSFREKLEIEEYRKVVQKKLEEIQDEENKINELDDKIKTCKEIFNQSLDVTV